MIKLPPQCYGADDLLINALYDEGSKICGNNPMPKACDYPADSFEPTNSKKDKVKTGLKIGGILAGATALVAGAWKLIKKFKP